MTDHDLASPRARRKAMTPTKRFDILVRDGFRCVYCGAMGAEAILEVDHVYPHIAGGPCEESNLVTACFLCNRGKAARTLPPPRFGHSNPVDDLSVIETELGVALNLDQYYLVRLFLARCTVSFVRRAAVQAAQNDPADPVARFKDFSCLCLLMIGHDL